MYTYVRPMKLPSPKIRFSQRWLCGPLGCVPHTDFALPHWGSLNGLIHLNWSKTPWVLPVIYVGIPTG